MIRNVSQIHILGIKTDIFFYNHITSKGNDSHNS